MVEQNPHEVKNYNSNLFFYNLVNFVKDEFMKKKKSEVMLRNQSIGCVHIEDIGNYSPIFSKVSIY